ncbi:MAG TPA: PaaI family thioesterase [Candidatus Limnocylindrales bacterium]
MENAGRGLQERYAPAGRCFGCGPANPGGLRIRTVETGGPGQVETRWQASKAHEAFDRVVNGGICATLLDCTMNWAAISALVDHEGAAVAPDTVTAELSVRYLAPTPSDRPVVVSARVVAIDGRRVTVEGTLEADGRTTASGRGTFVVVGSGHAATGRWRASPRAEGRE